MSTLDLSSYKELYIQTSRELVETLRKTLNELKNNKDDDENIALFHRSAHSLKSQSLVMGYVQTGLICRRLEAIFFEIKEKKLHLTDGLIQALEKTLEKLTHDINEIETHATELNFDEEKNVLIKLTGIHI